MREHAGITIIEEANEQSQASKEARAMAIIERDFEEFKRTRDYVFKHMSFLRGKKVPIEVTSIQYLPSHECIIINDLLLMPFSEVIDLIEELHKKEDHAQKNAN